jgi:hypothetical protein
MTARGMSAACVTRATSAAGGHLDGELRWMQEHDCPCDEWKSPAAAVGGHLELGWKCHCGQWNTAVEYD